MVLGEQLGIWVHSRKMNVSHAASVCLVGESYGRASAAGAVRHETLPEIAGKE
jgi:hypothetical protein